MTHAATVCNSVNKQRREYRPMSPEIVLTSSFYFDSFDEYAEGSSNEFDAYVYTRGTNPTTSLLEEKIAQLEGGERCKVFASGMGAISSVLFTLLSQGDHVLLVNTVYGASVSFIQALEAYGVEHTIVNSCITEDIAAAVRDNTKVIYFESPSSQKFELIDLDAVSALARERGILTVMDATWATPLFQQPLAHGIDVSIQSCSKYIGGHSDIVCGAVTASADLVRKVEECGYLLMGSTPSPLTSYLALRGLRTLPCRMRTLDENIRYVLDGLTGDSRIKKIHHPYCGDAWQRELAEKYLSGYGSLFAIDMADGDLEKLKVFVNSLKAVTLGVSWGGFESLALPVFKGSNAEAVRKRGLDVAHIRMYVGLEDPRDVLTDIRQALDRAYGD